MKKKIFSILLVAVICLSVPVVAFAASESIDEGRGTWYGGISNGYIYSKVCDETYDSCVYTVTVWAKDSKGDRDEKKGTTNAYGEAGAVKITKPATWGWFAVNTCGYKDISVNFI